MQSTRLGVPAADGSGLGLQRGDDAATGGGAEASTGASPRAAEVPTGPRSGPLGSTQSSCDTRVEKAGGVRGLSRGDRRRVRYGARALLWRASTLKSVRCCGRTIHQDTDPGDGGTQPRSSRVGQFVSIRRSHGEGREAVAGFGNLMTCGSVWACPRCSAVISQSRSEEVASAIRKCQADGGTVYLMTLTMRHSSGDRLAELWSGLSGGWRTTFGGVSWSGEKDQDGQGNVVRRWRTKGGEARSTTRPRRLGDAELFDVAGLVRTVEVTYGRPHLGGHGWHLHVHALVFTAGGLSRALRGDWMDRLRQMGVSSVVGGDWLAQKAFASRVFERWVKGVTKAGLEAPGAAAVDVRPITDGGAEFVGAYLAKSTYDIAAKLGLEVAAGSQTKEVRTRVNVTPFELLYELSEALGARQFGINTPRRWATVELEDGSLAIHDLETSELTSVTAPHLWRVWHEFEQGSKGRRQVTWSHRRKEPNSEGDPFDGPVAMRLEVGGSWSTVGRTRRG